MYTYMHKFFLLILNTYYFDVEKFRRSGYIGFVSKDKTFVLGLILHIYDISYHCHVTSDLASCNTIIVDYTFWEYLLV